MVRTNQGGSILGFVIIGAVMAVLLIGGAYVVRHNLASMLGGSTGAIKEDTPSDSPTEEEVTDTNDDENSQSDDKDTVVENDTKTDPNNHDDQPLPGGSSFQPQPQNNSPEHLPETGPGEVLMAGLVISSLIGALAAYIRSRALPSSL